MENKPEANESVAQAEEMGVNFYKMKALETAVYTVPDYPLLALGEEVGEVLGKIAKYGRKNNLCAADVVWMIRTDSDRPGIAELKAEIHKEMGDVMWQWSVLCHELGFMPSRVMAENLQKLADRKARDVLNGTGDNR